MPVEPQLKNRLYKSAKGNYNKHPQTQKSSRNIGRIFFFHDLKVAKSRYVLLRVVRYFHPAPEAFRLPVTDYTFPEDK
ncbi:hypothetical protein A4R26_16535 [Niastella populi]|uniref:Uncharacterized protein n=1 Tax=Niastella populi TaxID=550983 RepID=A0A1V9FYY9_9BACT|nr:hypothetical protein A4R26_16535 [Niastella populi]